MKAIFNLFKRRKKSDLAIARELADVLVKDINFRQTMQLTNKGI